MGKVRRDSTLVEEAVDSVDGSALVVSSEQEEVVRVFNFVCQEKADRFDALLTSINIISEEQVVALGWEPSVVEQAQEILVLSVNIA